MKKSEIIAIIREELQEANVTGTGATFTSGTGAQYATPKAFGKLKKVPKSTGYKEIKLKKRPYSTKLVDYLK